jgi:uncharacterized protein YggU (UPF0235/DUF167 family)
MKNTHLQLYVKSDSKQNKIVGQKVKNYEVCVTVLV